MKRFLGSLLVLLALAAPASAQTQLVCNQGSAKVPCSQPIGQAYIPGSIPATKIGTGTVSDTVFGYLNGVTSSIQTQLNTITAALVALSNAAPADIGTASAGVAATSSRSDHVHAHGNQLGGALHANAVAAGAAGFLTGTDKTKIDLVPTPSAGIQVLGSTYTISGDNGAYEDTGLAITLPDTGTYLVWYTARTNISAVTTAGAYILVELYNSTDGGALANSEEIGAYAGVIATSYYASPHVLTSVSVAASKVIKLYAKTVAPVSTSIRTINSDTNGRTNIGYLKIST